MPASQTLGRSGRVRKSGFACKHPPQVVYTPPQAMAFWITQFLNGVSFGMLLFLLAAGLSLIYGLMRILNLAHGSYYLLAAYVGLTVVTIRLNTMPALRRFTFP